MNTFLDNISHSQLEELSSQFRESKPFNYLVLDNFLSEEDAEQIANEFPSFEEDFWYNYENPLEIKKASNNWNLFPEKTYQFFQHVLSPKFNYRLERLVGGPVEIKLYPDVGLHGGGFHTHKAGGKLNPHLDYSIHPKLGKQRKINLILYIAKDWKPEYGGAFGLWNHNDETGRPGTLEKTVDCLFNRAVIFDTTQNSWHGICNEINSGDRTRNSLATYYLAEPVGDADKRMKVKYAPTEDQKDNKEIEDLIEQRQSMATFDKVYRKK
jgi:Rps23 Pro-64 3,4-dihydroxylase Tpa1-like proline 4-hydroxylase